jgi:hypothetical protein
MKVLYISAFALGLLVLRPGTAHATSYVVTTNAMTSAADGACSLVEAVTASNTGIAQNECQAGTGNDEIMLSGGTYLATASLRPTRTLTISGMGTTIIAAAFNGKPGSYLVGVIGANANLTIDNVTLRNDTTEVNRYISGIYASTEANVTSHDRLRVTGFTWSGIYAVKAQVSLEHALIDHNSSLNPAGVGHGGGVYVDSSGNGNHAFNFNHSSAVYNTALNDGGGIYFAADGGSHFFYSTFAKNTAKRGGGLFVGTKTGGYFEARHITVGRNNATVSGGGVYEQHNASGLFFLGSIIANNTLNNDASATTANMFRSAGAGNAFDNIWGAGVTANSLGCAPAAPNWNCTNNSYGTDAKLASDPISMGGAYYSMPVLMPLKGSPAIDYGASSGAEALDQRGLNGNIDGDGNGTVAIDAGAIERNQIWQSEETREWVNSSNDLVDIDVGGYPMGQLGRRLSANSTNDYVSYAVPIAEAGAYDITVKFKQASDGGKFKVGTASTSNGAYDETGFAEQNGYAAATSLPAAVNLGSRTFNAPGKYWIRFRVSAAGTGGGRALSQDYIKVRKTN